MSTIKVVFCGDSAVGKTAIIHYYTENEPGENLQPTVAAVFKKLVMNETNGSVIIELWDTAGDERYNSSITCCFKDANVIVIVYDITDNGTFRNVENKWIKLINDNSPPDISIVMVGNKVDLNNKRAVSIDQGLKCARNLKAYKFFETSALDGENIGELFQCIASIELNRTEKATNVNITEKEKGKKKCCQ